MSVNSTLINYETVMEVAIFTPKKLIYYVKYL